MLPKTVLLTKGAPLSKATILQILRNNWEAVWDRM